MLRVCVEQPYKTSSGQRPQQQFASFSLPTSSSPSPPPSSSFSTSPYLQCKPGVQQTPSQDLIAPSLLRTVLYTVATFTVKPHCVTQYFKCFTPQL